MSPDPMEWRVEMAAAIARVEVLLVRVEQSGDGLRTRLDTAVETARETGQQIRNAGQEIATLKVTIAKNEHRLDRIEGAPWRMAKWAAGGIGGLVSAMVARNYGVFNHWPEWLRP